MRTPHVPAEVAAGVETVAVWEAFEHATSGMALLDRRRRILAVNDAQLALSGHRREQLLRRPFVDFVREGHRMTQQRWQALLDRGGAFLGQVDLLHAAGGVVPVRYVACGQAARHRVLVIEMPARPLAGGGTPPLSARQLEILRLVALGHTGPEIAAELHLSHHTVRAHIAHAKERTGARSRAQLVAAAPALHGTAPIDSG